MVVIYKYFNNKEVVIVFLEFLMSDKVMEL